jgi:hypothetical protein
LAFLNEAELARRGAGRIYTRNVVASRSLSRISIFLSHSHLDRVLVQSFIKDLDEVGVSVYVDWSDSTLPRITNRTTANTIKEAIKTNRLFVVLATANALRSRWVPWEIGVADQMHSGDDILIVPVADATGRFEGNEYLQLYNRVELVNGLLRVIRPNEYAAFSGLAEHLRSRSGILFG